MKLIIGGAYHGKLDYALERYALERASVYQCTETTPEIDFSKEIINSLHLWVLGRLRAGSFAHSDPLNYLENHLELLQTKIVICDDISCGVVPMESEMRRWRETVGRCLVFLSGHAEEVVRVFYGLGTKLK